MTLQIVSDYPPIVRFRARKRDIITLFCIAATCQCGTEQCHRCQSDVKAEAHADHVPVVLTPASGLTVTADLMLIGTRCGVDRAAIKRTPASPKPNAVAHHTNRPYHRHVKTIGA
jgi:hypothetical protein